MKKSFNQLKKDLQVGVLVKTLTNNCKPEMNGQVRAIGKVQTNAIAFLRDDDKLSWLWWGKASCYEYEDNVFKVYDEPRAYNNYTRNLLFVYEIMR